MTVNNYTYQCLVTAIFLGICLITDIRSRQIYPMVIAAYSVLALTGQVIFHIFRWQDMVLNVMPGIICLLISVISKEALGYGDSMIIFAVGYSLGVVFCIQIVCSSIFLAGAYSMLLVVFRRGSRKTEIPFVPFLMIGFIIWKTGGA